jgi:hypothetical protein
MRAVKGKVMKTVLAVLLASTGLLAADPAVSDGMSNGKAWNGFGGGDKKIALMLKVVLLVGLSDGFHQARDEVSYGLDDLVSALSPSKPSADRVEAVKKAASEVVPNLLPTGSDLVTMIASLDEFYSDSQNLDIPIPVAARYEKAKLGGQLPTDAAEHLRRLRTLYKVSKELDSLQGK